MSSMEARHRGRRFSRLANAGYGKMPVVHPVPTRNKSACSNMAIEILYIGNGWDLLTCSPENLDRQRNR